jgi:hypothetical protein
MRKSLAVIAIIVGLAPAACSKDTLDVDVSRFARLAEPDSLNYSAVTPGASYQYWELRYAFGAAGGAGDRILASGGTRQRSELSAATLAALQSAAPPSGFFNGCLPGHCYTFILAVDADGAVRVVNTRSTLEQFLGPITSVAEAALIVQSYNTFWDLRNTATGVREVGDGWEFLVLQLVRDCAPVQTDVVHILVRHDGTSRELGRMLHSRLENACV